MLKNNEKFYAIKIGNNVENLIVNSWKECKEYVIGYPAIYKSFDKERQAKRWLANLTEYDVKNILAEYKIQRYLRLKEKLEIEYGFEIPGYIADEIINGKHYSNLCALINLAVLNNKISKKNAKILKEEELKKKKLNVIQ